MGEGNQYMLGSLERIQEQLHRTSIYAPALRVVIRDQVPERAQPYVEKILDGEGVFWDVAPLKQESWEVYAALTGFYSQFLRLVCQDIGLDVWPGWQRSRWVSLDWYPIARDLGWKVACRPLRGVFFRHTQPEMPEAVRYLASWPHGWLSFDECEAYAPYLAELLVRLGREVGLEWGETQLERRFTRPGAMDREARFDLFNICADRDTPQVWQLLRGWALLEAMREAITDGRDLISLGY